MLQATENYFDFFAIRAVREARAIQDRSQAKMRKELKKQEILNESSSAYVTPLPFAQCGE